MSQQHQQPPQEYSQQPQGGHHATPHGQQPTQYGQEPTGFQAGGMGGQQMGGQQPGGEFEDSLPSELRVVLHDVNQVANVAEWCADRCLEAGPQLADCVRTCEDIADVADLNEKLIARDSKFGPELAEAFVKVAQEGLTDLQQFRGQNPAIDETISVIRRALDSSTKELQRLGIQTPAPTPIQQPY